MSEVGEDSRAFELLHPGVQRWIWHQGWEGLRDIQERATPLLLDPGPDVIIAATTAGGKTESAFLPIASRLATMNREPGCGFEALYIGPLRALINDQTGRMESLCESLDLPVTKWHGDVAESAKRRARRQPSGIVLTTPESLEAMLVRRGGETARLFAALEYVVVDEMHVFLDSPRGRQLQSLLHRLEAVLRRRVVRIGLSATLADMGAAQAYLRPQDPDSVAVLESRASQDIRLQIRGVAEPPRPPPDTPMPPSADQQIQQHLFDTLRGKRSLIFGGSRQRVEQVTAGLSTLTEALGVPVEFFAHHGSLSREHREDAEQRMRDPGRPCSIVCTTTLELGIDVGAIESIAQIGPGQSVSGLRQRLGRAGRRQGQAAVMRLYVKEPQADPGAGVLSGLRFDLVQAIAMVQLLLRRWNEPGHPGRLHLSTLVHQVMAVIAQYGGASAQQLWSRLCSMGAPFATVTPDLFQAVLRRMAEATLIEQVADGTIVFGARGESISAGHDFFTVFATPVETKVLTESGRMLGMLPSDRPFAEEQLLILAGRRWKVTGVDRVRHEIVVAPALAGAAPNFGGGFTPPHEGVVQEMRRLYTAAEPLPYLDPMARTMLDEARQAYRQARLAQRSWCQERDSLILFPWTGGPGILTLALALQQHGILAAAAGLVVALPAEQSDACWDALRRLASEPLPNGTVLAQAVTEKEIEKYDSFLGEELLCLAYGHERLDVAALPRLASGLLASRGR